MNNLKFHIRLQYEKTKWPFFNVLELKKEFGREAIKSLIETKTIRLRKGVNNHLVELIKIEQ